MPRECSLMSRELTTKSRMGMPSRSELAQFLSASSNPFSVLFSFYAVTSKHSHQETRQHSSILISRKVADMIRAYVEVLLATR